MKSSYNRRTRSDPGMSPGKARSLVEDNRSNKSDESFVTPLYTIAYTNKVYKVGIYGWRKRLLYSLIIFIAILATINAALVLWIMRLLDLTWSGMGPIRFYPDGILVKGTSYVRSNLYAKMIRSTKNSTLKIIGNNVTIEAYNASSGQVNKLNINSDLIQIIANEIRIKSENNENSFIMNNDHFSYNLKQLHINTIDSIKFNGSLQTTFIESSPLRDLKIQSKTSKILLKSPKEININSFSSTNITSLKDIYLDSTSGEIFLNGSDIRLLNLKTGIQLPLSQPISGVYQLCICSNGRLFKALPKATCDFDVKICEKIS